MKKHLIIVLALSLLTLIIANIQCGGGSSSGSSGTPHVKVWDTPALFETTDDDLGGYLQVVFAPDDNAMAIWTQVTNTEFSVFASYYINGVGWGPPELIETDDVGGASDIQLAADAAGNFIALWTHQDGALKANAWTNRYVKGSGWGTAEAVEASSTSVQAPRLTVDPSGNAIAVWGEDNLTNAMVWANRYVKDVGWDTAEEIGRGDTMNPGWITPRVSGDDHGNAVALWSVISSAQTSIFANRYISGTGWGTAELIELAAEDAASPQIACAGDGDAIAVWTQLTNTKTSVFANRYISGTGWGTPTLLETDDTVNASWIGDVAFDSAGNALTAWNKPDSGQSSVFANRYISGTGWSAPELIETNDTQITGEPVLAVDSSGNAFAGWKQFDGSKWHAWVNRYVNGTGWATAQLMENNATQDAMKPCFAIKSNGNAFALWLQDNSGYDIWISEFK